MFKGFAVLLVSVFLFAADDISNQGGLLNISVTNNNKALTGAAIKIKFPEKYNATTSLTTDSNGTAAYNALFNGDYVLELLPGSNYPGATNTTTVSNKGTYPVVFALTSKGGAINISVVKNSMPVSGAMIKITHPDKTVRAYPLITADTGKTSLRVNDDGEYSIELLGGSDYKGATTTVNVSGNDTFPVDFIAIANFSNNSYNEADFIKYKFAGFYTDDINGRYYSQTGLITYDKSINNFNTVLALFLWQNFSMNDNINLELRQANVSYVSDWLRVSLGRVDYSNLFSPCYYFGRYNLMGSRRIQGFFVTTNFLLKTGVSEEKLVEIPPTAITFGFVPNYYTNFATTLYDNPYWFAQFRTRIRLSDLFGMKDISLALAFNYSQTRDILFWYSSLSGQPSISITANIAAGNDYSLYGEYAMQNISEASSYVLVGGAKMKLSTLTYGIFDSIIFEAQLPQDISTNNAFTGGNFYFPAEASVPQPVFFMKISKQFGGLEVSLSSTNAVGDYTYSRPSASSLSNSIPVPLFKGNEDPTSLTEFYSRQYSVISYRLNVAYKF